MLPAQVPANENAGAPGIERLTLVLLVAAAVALRLARLTSKPFWFDECVSVELARLSWNNFLHVVWWREANMMLYYLLLRAWLSVGGHYGQSEFYIRSLSALLAAATIPAVYWLARLLYSPRVALLAAALFTFNAYNLRYAQEARSYALLVLLATLSSGFLIAWLRQPQSCSPRRIQAGYILAGILALYAHFYALLLLAAHWLALGWMGAPGLSDRGAERPRKIRRAGKLIGIAGLPLLIFVAKTGAGPIGWIHRPGIRDLLAFSEQLAGGSSWLLPLMYAAACLAAAAPLGRNLWRRDRNWETWRVQFLLVWLLLPVMLTALLSLARPVFLSRYLIFCQPALVILAAAGIARPRPEWLSAPVLAGFLLLALQGVFFVYAHDFDDQRDGSGAAADFILDHTEAGDGVIFDIAAARVPYEFYRSLRAGEDTASPRFTGQLGPEILFPHEGAGLDYRDFQARLTPDRLRAVVRGHRRVWVVLIYTGDVKPDATTVLLTRTLPEWFSRVERWQFPKVEVRRYSSE